MDGGAENGLPRSRRRGLPFSFYLQAQAQMCGQQSPFVVKRSTLISDGPIVLTPLAEARHLALASS